VRAFVLFLVAFPLAVAAATPDANTIVRRMKDALEPERSSTRTLTVVVTGKDGESAEFTAGQAHKRVGNANRMLTALLAPDALRGIAVLVEEGTTKPDRQWIYLPTVRRVREIVPVESYQTFLNTDFTYADMGFVSRRETYRLLGSETRDGTRTYRVQATPRASWYYSRFVTFVAVDSWLPVRREFYDPAGLLWKVETWRDTTAIDGVPIPMRVKMEDVRQGGSTELRVSDVLWDRELPDDLFDPGKLPEAAGSAVWNPPRAH